MQDIVLDGRDMTSREAAHEQLYQRLSFPSYYGRNLDALFDCLTEIGYPVSVTVNHAADMQAALGRYGSLLLRVFADAALANGNLTLEINE